MFRAELTILVTHTFSVILSIKSFFPEIIGVLCSIAIFLSFSSLRRHSKTGVKLFATLLLITSLLAFYSTFVERKIITVHETTIHTGVQARIAVFADLHVGIWKNEHYLDRVVDKVNQIPSLDAVVIPGDITYLEEGDAKHDLDRLFQPLSRINVPVYYVFGNHDVGYPGPSIKPQLIEALEKNHVIILENRFESLNNSFELYGAGEMWAGEDNADLANRYRGLRPLIVIAHNPNFAKKLNPNQAALVISGHTHCGQIRIPFVYKYVLPDDGYFDKGEYTMNGNKVFISCGLGEVGLPMRLNNPPVIDVLNLV